MNVFHGTGAEARGKLFFAFFALAALVIESDLSEPPVDIDLPPVLSPLNLHLPLDILPELHHILLLRHQLIRERSTTQCRLVVLHLVNLDEVLSRLLWAATYYGLRVIRNFLDFFLYLG